MPSNVLAAAVLATGIWVAFAFAIVVGSLTGPGGDGWVMARSEKAALHPTLVRRAKPQTAAAR